MHSNGRPPKTRYSKSILQLSPFVKDGILSVAGRLRHSHLPYDQKFPIILSPQHPVTELIVDYYHRRDAHSGTLQVLSAVREKFWIVHGQSSVRKILRKCVLCKMKNAKTSRQWMAPLPGSRVQTGRTPFDHTMIDYLGPFKVKLGRKEFKRWIFLATCLATRACHLEVVESLETDAFLQAFFRFCDRRCRPSHCFSDNASTMVGAQKVLADGIRRWNQNQISNALAQQGIRWTFSPALSPHHNGAVERLVKETKKSLYFLMEGKTLTDYSLLSFVTGVERILNDRPLTPLSDDPRDLEALTPNSILTGRLDPALSS